MFAQNRSIIRIPGAEELLSTFSGTPTSIGGLLTAHEPSNQVERWILVVGRSPRQFVVRLQALLHMPQNPGNQCRLLDAVNDPQLATAIGTDFNIDKVN